MLPSFVILADIPRTITIRFLKPTKLGIASASWLRHDVCATEWTAATCLYFLLMRTRRRASGVLSISSTVVSTVEPLSLTSLFEMTDLFVRTVFKSVPVTVEVSTAVAIVAIRRLWASILCGGSSYLYLAILILFYFLLYCFVSIASEAIKGARRQSKDGRRQRSWWG